MTPAFRIREANVDDTAAVLQLFDEAVAWFATFGNEAQWGTEPWSTQPRQQRRVREQLASGGAWLALGSSGEVAGALVLGQASDDVPAATEPELYVRVLIGSRDHEAKGAGRHLMRWADEQARAAGVCALRVDCYAGGSGKLIEFYESCGYQRLETFDVDGWPGQLLGRRLDS